MCSCCIFSATYLLIAFYKKESKFRKDSCLFWKTKLSLIINKSETYDLHVKTLSIYCIISKQKQFIVLLLLIDFCLYLSNILKGFSRKIAEELLLSAEIMSEY